MGPDDYRAALDSVFAQPAYQWPTVRVEPLAPWLSRLLRWLGEVWEWLTGLLPAPSEVGVPAAWLLIAAGVALLVHAAFRAGRAGRRARELAVTAGSAGFGPVRDAAWYLAEAEALAGSGRFGEAMLAAFHGAMLALEQGGRLRPTPGRTPRELARAADLPAPAREELGLLVGTMYRAAFAQESVAPEQFRAWLAALRGIADAPAR